MDSLDDATDLFSAESEKLENLIDHTLAKSDLTIAEIIETYYQIMNVSSMITMLKQPSDGKSNYKTLLQKIQETEKVISYKFNSNLHPRIMQKFSNSIKNIINTLQSNDSEKKSKEDIEKEAKLYEKLRQTMSAKEFVEQYDKGLSHD